MTSTPRITLAYAERLESPQVVVTSDALSTMHEMARLTYPFLQEVVRSQAPGAVLRPDDFISRTDLAKLSVATGLVDDPDMAELCFMGALSVQRIPAAEFDAGAHATRMAISARVHELFRLRPELLHPNIHVDSNVATGGRPLLHHLVISQYLPLAPHDFVAMTAASDDLSHTLRLSVYSTTKEGVPLLDRVLRAHIGGVETATALLACGHGELPLGDSFTSNIVEIAAKSATVARWQFDHCCEMLVALQRRLASVAAHLTVPRHAHPDTLRADLVAGARDQEHPVAMLLVRGTLYCAGASVKSPGSAFELPPPPPDAEADGAEVVQHLCTAASLVNDLLEPGFRMPIEQMSSSDLMKIVAIAAPCANRAPNVLKAWANRHIDRASPHHILDWVIDRAATDGTFLTSDEFDAVAPALQSVIDPQLVGQARSRVINRAMAAVIAVDAASSGTIQSNTPQPRDRRRNV